MQTLYEITDVNQLPETRELLITWKDNHRSLFAYTYLRAACPCASCVDEWSGRRKITEEQVSSTIRIEKIAPVGRYAVRFEWSDGHGTGIYSVELLRKLCPCFQCQSLQQQKTK